jgi:hypothetical protein
MTFCGTRRFPSIGRVGANVGFCGQYNIDLGQFISVSLDHNEAPNTHTKVTDARPALCLLALRPGASRATKLEHLCQICAG